MQAIGSVIGALGWLLLIVGAMVIGVNLVMGSPPIGWVVSVVMLAIGFALKAAGRRIGRRG